MHLGTSGPWKRVTSGPGQGVRQTAKGSGSNGVKDHKSGHWIPGSVAKYPWGPAPGSPEGRAASWTEKQRRLGLTGNSMGVYSENPFYVLREREALVVWLLLMCSKL